MSQNNKLACLSLLSFSCYTNIVGKASSLLMLSS